MVLPRFDGQNDGLSGTWIRCSFPAEATSSRSRRFSRRSRASSSCSLLVRSRPDSWAGISAGRDVFTAPPDRQSSQSSLTPAKNAARPGH